MTEDVRCCGTGTCIINADGHCWCGQQWDGQKMCFPQREQNEAHERSGSDASAGEPSTPSVP